MKILFYLRIVVMGGAERYLLTLLPELKKRNIEVGFFCTEQKNNEEIITYFKNRFAEFDIPFFVCKASSPFSLKAAKNLAAVAVKGGYTIISIHLIHAEIIAGLSKIFFNNPCKIVMTKHGYFQKFMDVHGLDPAKINHLDPAYQLEKFLQRYAFSNFAVSKGLASFYIRSGICKPSKMNVIYHGIETTAPTDNYAKMRYSNNQVLILGRLRKLKGHHFLIDAMKIISEKVPDARLVIVGSGEEKECLVRMVDNYKLNNCIIFAGYTDNVGEYIASSDIVAAPSTAEAFGLVVLEAYSYSKPVIAFNVTAFNENIIDNETGCLVAPYDTAELAEKIIYLLQNKTVAMQYGTSGNKLMRNKFSLDETISNTIDFFKGL